MRKGTNQNQRLIAGFFLGIIVGCQPEPTPIRQPLPPSRVEKKTRAPHLQLPTKDGEQSVLEATFPPQKAPVTSEKSRATTKSEPQGSTSVAQPTTSTATEHKKVTLWTPGGPARLTSPRTSALQKRFVNSLQALGPTYKPRTHHFAVNGSPKYTNRLILENSPYLLQHAHNPVDWFPWGKEAFELAKRLDRPVLMSVGYATCHWCHVMERESFEDLEIADYMNQNFVCIKVDREERPDVDSVYMDAVHMLAGRGGWPMTIVMTPDKRPFFAGTYFPPRDGVRGARRGFLSILNELTENYRTNRTQLLQKAASISERLGRQSQSRPAAGVPGPAALKAAAMRFVQIHDPKWGGFGRRPKFPRPVTLDFLMRYYRRTNDTQVLTAITKTLDGMADGGMYDQIGGGFHRYSVDDQWLVPHFEKMLYDNGQLAATYLDAWQVTSNARYANVATDILNYVAREMIDPSGAFWSATDADSEGVEGKFFVWSRKELDTILGAEIGRIAAAWWGVTEAGNFEHANILHTWKPKSQVAAELGISIAKLNATLKNARHTLYEYRRNRIPPLTDDKVLTAWNGLMISGFARGGFLLNRPDFTQIAKTAATRILSTMQNNTDGRLLRTWRAGGAAKHRAYLEDYAFLIQGLIDLFEATSTGRWLSEAIRLSDLQLEWYQDTTNGGFYRTARDAEKLLTRQKPNYDGAEPSGNSITAKNLLRIYEYTGDERYRKAAESTFRWAANRIARGGPAVPAMLSALDMMLDKPRQVFVIQGTDSNKALKKVLQKTFLPNRTMVMASSATVSNLQSLVPSLAGKFARQGKTTAYVCEGGICQRPTSDPEVLETQLKEVRPYPAQE